jgi:Skp family chaperone for outer membrane proteins
MKIRIATLTACLLATSALVGCKPHAADVYAERKMREEDAQRAYMEAELDRRRAEADRLQAKLDAQTAQLEREQAAEQLKQEGFLEIKTMDDVVVVDKEVEREQQEAAREQTEKLLHQSPAVVTQPEAPSLSDEQRARLEREIHEAYLEALRDRANGVGTATKDPP